MRQSGRRIHATEFGTGVSPTGESVRHVFPMNHSSQFWVTESGVSFEKHRVNGAFIWANGGEPTKLPNRVSMVWAIALAWTEPPELDPQFPLRPICLPNTDQLSPSAIAWTKCSSHRPTGSSVFAKAAEQPEATCCGGADSGTTWSPVVSLPVYTHIDGHVDAMKLCHTDYEIAASGVLRVKKAATHSPLRTHLVGRPLRLALPEGSAFVNEVFTARRNCGRTHRHDSVYDCIIDAGHVDTARIRGIIGSMGNEQTIHSAVFQCIKVRPAVDIDRAFFEATTSPSVRRACIDAMRSEPDAKSSAIVSRLRTEPTWQLYAEVRIARELILKFQFDPPEGW